MARCPLTLFALAAVLSLSACDQFTPSRSFTGALEEALKDKSVASVDISKLSDFDWDALYIFSPYAVPTFICARLEFDKPRCDAAQFADVGEGEFLLVFMRSNNIARRETLSRNVADFAPNSLGQSIPRTEATFTVNRNSGRKTLACGQCQPEKK